MEWMKIIAWVWVVAIVWCAWDFFTAPVMPDNYNEEGINPDYKEIEDGDE